METKIKALSLVFQANHQLVNFVDNELLEVIIPRGNLLDSLLEDLVFDNYGNEHLDTESHPYVEIKKVKELDHSLLSYRKQVFKLVYLFKTQDEEIRIPFENITNVKIKFDVKNKLTTYQFTFDNSIYVKSILTFERIVTTPRHIFLEYTENKLKTTDMILNRLVQWYGVNLYAVSPIKEEVQEEVKEEVETQVPEVVPDPTQQP